MLPAAWRARWWLWALPLAVVIANVVLLIVHPGRTGAGFADMQQELERETKTLQSLADKERAVEAVLDDARSSREALSVLYRRGFATQAERLTQLITEVKKLAQRAGLEPTSISYPEEELDDYGLVRMSLLFNVQGSYPQVRMLVNLLEHSDLFLVLEQVGLSNSSAALLGINLQLSTFFVRDPAALEAIEEPLPEAPAQAERSSVRSSRS
jgi:Tfp pilus assembly protein PilO